MIKSLNGDSALGKGKTFIVEGQCADSVLLGLPHNLLLQMYRPGLSSLFKIVNPILPAMGSKNSFYKRLVYRLKKVVSSLGQPTWIECLLYALNLDVSAGSPYVEHLRAQLSEYYQHYGSMHKAVAHFFMFRIIQAREMQKYQALPRRFKVVVPFADPGFVGRAFATPDYFFIEKGKKKKPVFDLVMRYFPGFYTRQKTSPFYVQYALSNSRLEPNGGLLERHRETIMKNLISNDADRDLKIESLNLLDAYSL